MIELLTHANHLENLNCAEGKAPSYGSKKYQREVYDLRALYDAILAQALAENPIAPSTGKRGGPKQSKTTNPIGRLHDLSNDVWRFMTPPDVLFTNNLSEKAVRTPKVKQKVWAAFERAKVRPTTVSSALIAPPCTSKVGKVPISLSHLSQPSSAHRLRPASPDFSTAA